MSPVSYILLSVFILILMLSFLPARSEAYMTLVVSSATTESTEQAVLQQLATQFNVSIFVNPLVPNTYQVMLFGLNPSYQPSIVTIDTTTWFNDIAALQATEAFISTDSYTNGWADGEQYDRSSNMQALGSYMTLCSSSDTFILDGSTWNTVAVDEPTCRGVLYYAWQQFYQLNYSTPTSIPGYGPVTAIVPPPPPQVCPAPPPCPPPAMVTLSSFSVIQPTPTDTVDCYNVSLTPNGDPTTLYMNCPGSP